MQETQVPPRGWEDLLEEGMETHPRILAQEIPRTEEPGGLQSVGSQKLRHDLAHTRTHCNPTNLNLINSNSVSRVITNYIT